MTFLLYSLYGVWGTAPGAISKTLIMPFTAVSRYILHPIFFGGGGVSLTGLGTPLRLQHANKCNGDVKALCVIMSLHKRSKS